MSKQYDEGPASRPITQDDLRGWSSLQPHDHESSLTTLDGIRRRAARDGRVSREEAFRQRHGDGELMRWADGTSALDLLMRYAPALCTELEQENGRLAEPYRMQLRLALVEGYSEIVRGNLTGSPPVTVARLLNSEPCRRALVLLPHRPLVLIIPDDLYQGLVRQRPALHPHTYVRVTVKEPGKGFEAAAWLSVPGCDDEELRLLRDELGRTPAEPAAVTGGTDVLTRARTAARQQAAPAAPGRATDSRPTVAHGTTRATETADDEETGADEDAEPDPRPVRRPWLRHPAVVAAMVAALGGIAAAAVPALLSGDGGGGDGKGSPDLSITGTCTRAGDQLDVRSSGFTPGGTYTISITDPDGRPYPLTIGDSNTATSAGSLRTRWMCQEGDTSGLYTARATDESSGRSVTTTFRVDSVG